MMEILIDEIDNRIIIKLNPKEYFLTKCEDDFCGEYALSHKINMDYAGKPPQVGSEAIYLDKREYQKLKGLVDEVL